MAFFKFKELAQTLIEDIFQTSTFGIELGIVIKRLEFGT